jgi:hypothetical protein
MMKKPDDTNLPFFAYGMFKPNQLCFSRIKDVVEKKEQHEIRARLYERDGVPLIALNNGGNNVKGWLIWFRDGDDGYDKVIEIEPEKIYSWEQIETIEGQFANVLVGIDFEKGATEIIVNQSWSGRKDPYFNEAIIFIDDIRTGKYEFRGDLKKFFSLQIAYNMLWTSIERFLSLKYSLKASVNKNMNCLAQEKSFISGLEENVNSERKLYSTKNLEEHTLSVEKPFESLRYYYLVRCNSVHRGKAVHHDIEILSRSLNELLAIFKNVLKTTFRIEHK